MVSQTPNKKKAGMLPRTTNIFRKPRVRFKTWWRLRLEKKKRSYSKKEIARAKRFLLSFPADNPISQIKKQLNREKKILNSLPSREEILRQLVNAAKLGGTGSKLDDAVEQASQITEGINDCLAVRGQIQQYWQNYQIVKPSPRNLRELQICVDSIERLQTIKSRVTAILDELRIE